jgi:hypothetical protein
MPDIKLRSFPVAKPRTPLRENNLAPTNIAGCLTRVIRLRNAPPLAASAWKDCEYKV